MVALQTMDRRCPRWTVSHRIGPRSNRRAHPLSTSALVREVWTGSRLGDKRSENCLPISGMLVVRVEIPTGSDVFLLWPYLASY